MIDYEKLKTAHKLISKLKFDSFDMQLSTGTYNNIVLHYDDNEGLSHEYEFDLLDDIIAKLQELTKPEKPRPKYIVGDAVWRLEGNSPWQMTIAKIQHENSGIFYKDIHGDWWKEEQLYPSRESLIDAQIEYWKSLKCPSFEGKIKGFSAQELCQCDYSPELKYCPEHGKIEGIPTHGANGKILISGNHYIDNMDFETQESCQHESDGKMAVRPYPANHTCKKCGEFY